MYKTIMLPAVLYGCETLSLALMEEHRLRMFENRVLRMIFGPNRYEVTKESIKLHNGEHRDLYFLPIRIMTSRRMRWSEHVARMGEETELV
jgi:hypothetical protein